MKALRLTEVRGVKPIDVKDVLTLLEKPITIKLYKPIISRGVIYTHLLKSLTCKGEQNIAAEIILQSTGNKYLSYDLRGDVYICEHQK